MGLQGEKKLEDILTGALIGLARTTYSHLKTENTDRVVTCALSVLVRVDADEEELEKQYRIMKNSRNIVEALGNVHEYTGYDNGAGDLIGRALKEIEIVSGYDEVLKDIEASIADVESILDDIHRQAEAYLSLLHI